MSLVAIETPTVRVASARQALKFLDPALGIVTASQLLQVVSDELVEALAESVGLLPGARDKLLVDGQGDIHEHSICAQVFRVNKVSINEIRLWNQFLDFHSAWTGEGDCPHT